LTQASATREGERYMIANARTGHGNRKRRLTVLSDITLLGLVHSVTSL